MAFGVFHGHLRPSEAIQEYHVDVEVALCGNESVTARGTGHGIEWVVDRSLILPLSWTTAGPRTGKVESSIQLTRIRIGRSHKASLTGTPLSIQGVWHVWVRCIAFGWVETSTFDTCC